MNRYYIAIIPPEHISRYVNDIRESVAIKYETKGALNQPPHITLIPPFEIDKDEELIEILDTYVKLIDSNLLIKLRDYGTFPSSTIFIKVEPNERLNYLATNLSEVLQEKGITKPFSYEYHPHMTIAFKDLSEENYQLMWNEYKDKKIYLEWEVNLISLLKYENKRWSIVNKFPFNS